ncbi:MAG: DUF4231 domain-containing protein, partial [Bacteroidota bacterium]
AAMGNQQGSTSNNPSQSNTNDSSTKIEVNISANNPQHESEEGSFLEALKKFTSRRREKIREKVAQMKVVVIPGSAMEDDEDDYFEAVGGLAEVEGNALEKEDDPSLIENQPPEQIDPLNQLTEQLAKGQEFATQFQSTFGTLMGDTSVVPIEDTTFDDEPTTLQERLFFNKRDRKLATEIEKAEIKAKLGYLSQNIFIDKEKYRKWERKSKNWALTFRLMSSALAAVVTVLLGINVTDTLRDWGVDWWINTIALTISAFISIIGVIQGFFDANELYIKYTDTANKLEALLSTIEFFEFGMDYADINDVNAIKIEYDNIIRSTHDYEVRVRAKEQEKFNEIKKICQKIIEKYGPPISY